MTNRTKWTDSQGRVWRIEDHPRTGITISLTGQGFEDDDTAIAVIADCANRLHLRAGSARP